MPMPGMARPVQPAQRPWRWLGLSLILLVIIFGGLASATILLTHDVSSTRSFTVGNQPKLALTANSADIHVVSGAANQMTVVAHRRVFVGDNDPIPVHYGLSSDQNTLTVSSDEERGFSFGFSFSLGINFEVTVPSQTVLDVQTSSGDITAQGVNNQMSLTTSSGTITTDGGRGQIILKTSSGNITASNISGQMTLSTSSGSVTATNASASGNSSFKTSSGDITYRGSLAPGGTYDFHDSSGSIDLTLPGNAALQVQAVTQSGSIDSDFSEVRVLDNSSGALASGTVGSAPYALVTAQTSSGDIHLHKA
jgi:DUF4097 and DUF4098 domain-containing protein YvlB